MTKVIYFFLHPARVRKYVLKCAVWMLIFSSVSMYVQAQTVISIIQYADQPEVAPIVTITDSLKVQGDLLNHLSLLHASGYIYAVTDTSYFVSDTCFSRVFRGDKYHIQEIRMDAEQRAIIEASNIKKIPVNKPLDSVMVFNFLKTIVRHQANHGYPFAKAYLSNIEMDKGDVTTQLNVYNGKYIIFDSVVLSGKLDMSPAFFRKMLDIRAGRYYEHDKVIKAQSRLANLPYLSLQSAPYVRFINDKASVILPIDPKPASRFDFLIGVLPQVIDGVRKWTITGDIIAETNNAFRSGEYIFFQFKRLQAENLELSIKNTIPYLFGLPVGSHLDFRIFKNGNLNLDLYFDGGLQWLYNGYNSMRIFNSYRSSSLLDVDADKIKTSKKLPSRLDFTYSGLGTGITMDNLNYKYNPTQGFNTSLTLIAGRKKIIPNRQIVEIEGFANSYDTLKLNTLQAEFKAHFEWYTAIRSWASIKTGLYSGLLFNENTLRTNELMRIGGNRLLRGFDEESLLTDFYGFGTFEFRFIFDQNSYMSLPFVDFGYVHLQEDRGTPKVTPVIGLGLGLNFGTKAGIFNLSFAAGRVAPQPIDFSRMKIHFGYVNLF